MKTDTLVYKITLTYLLAAGIWMSCCDFILLKVGFDPETVYSIKRIKDVIFILTTAIILYIYLKNHFEKLRIAEGKSQQSQEFKSALINNISNNLIYPMNAIYNASSHLKSAIKYSPERIDDIEIIHRNSNHLTNVITEMVDLSLIQSGDIEIHSSNVDLNQLITDLYEKHKALINKRTYFSKMIGVQTEKYIIHTDGHKIRQILRRLLDNAIKFTSKGEIQFGYAIKDSHVIFFVKDTGIGIEPTQKNAIFDVFHQETENFTLYNGLGLGLSICKTYVQLLGGKIWMDSDMGIGTTFYFTIPTNHVLSATPIKQHSQKMQKAS